MPDQSTPLLGYLTSTSPAPLQASSPGTPTLGRINLAVTDDRQDVYCDRIQIAVPADDHAGGAYFTEQPNFSTSSGQWTVASLVQVTGEELGLAQSGQFYRATFRSVDEEYDLIGDTLDFGLSGPLSISTGPLAYYIQEHSGTTSDRDDYTKKSRVLTLTVTEPVFYLHSFLARGEAGATAPRTKFTGGSPVYLTWESNGTYFRLYDGDGDLVQEGPETYCSIGYDVITMDTTFTLVASMSPETEGNGSGFEPIYQYATLTVTITDPTLEGLTVREDITARSGLDVSGRISADGDVSIAGDVTVRSRLDVEETLSALGDLTVSGYTTARGRLDVSGDLTVDSSLTVGSSLTANSELTVNGDLTANGYVSAVGDDTHVRIRELRGPYGEKISINSSVDVLSDNDFTIREGLSVDKDIKRGGSGVLADGDEIGLNNTYYEGWLYATMFVNDNRRTTAVWDPGDRVVESSWRVSRD
ncbi:hypothetical protein ACFYYH_33715 [Streptomyces sp. NPDC002018]|uniref:hypothetical protein n=1 Tax=Streptomyces sp. NPDC002018 TaxID=3364629 RepID=UPI0036A4BEF7